MMKRNIYTLLLSTLLIVGCQTDTVSPAELVDYQRKLVVNAVFSTDRDAGEPLELELSTSEAAISSELPDPVEDAVVTIRKPDQSVVMTHDMFNRGTYTGNLSIAAGESVNLRIEHPSFPNVTSTIALPPAINASGVYVEDGATDTSGFPADLLQVTFQDQPGVQNYYRMNVDYFNQTLGVWTPLDFDKSDPSLNSYNSFQLNDASVLFTDELFNGRSKTITTLGPGGLVSGNTGAKYRIVISSISRDYYKYINSLQRARDAQEITFGGGFNNAVVVHTNIDGGLGILGAQTRNIVDLR